jgi:eukaryotic-like serine/threonine-protein kinase
MANAVAENSWHFTPGTEIGPGRTVVRLLGGGDRYEAWLGWDEHLCSPVVLKMLRPDQVESPRARAAIAREGEMLRSLSHPGIVRSFAVDTEGERPYLVLEFLDGPRLSTLLRKFGPLTPEQLVPVATELGSSLCYMHHEGLLHLDVKPQNLIMGAPPRLIDLSIVRRQDEVHSLSTPLGTDAYMAPEQCDPALLRTMGPSTDVWGLGATLYEAANGFRPFRRRADGEPYPQLTDDPAPFHHRVPPAIADPIRACLQRDPARRPSMSELAEAFDPLIPTAREVALKRLRRRVR